MAIKATHPVKKNREKPKEILELEVLLGIEFFVFDNYKIDDERERMDKPFCGISDEKKIIALTIDELGLTDISFLDSFSNLEFLSLYENNIRDIVPLSKLKSLKRLLLMHNVISDISPLSTLSDLSVLFLEDNPIVDFSPIRNLTKLQTLDIADCGVKDLKCIGGLKNLSRLYLERNQIIDITILKEFDKLKYLWLHHNKIEDISAIQNLDLSNIALQGNSIRTIPRKIAKRFHYFMNNVKHNEYGPSNVVLSDNPLTFPPYSVIEIGEEPTENYYDSAEQFGYAPLSEGRIIFIGDGSSGKSSIIEKILHNTFEQGREQTNGIKIEHWRLNHPEDGRDLNFHIWDFGGQEIQHAVHKFFFTEGCLYVLVLDNRKEEEPEYWLQQIESLGGKAPVLVVFNKQDENAAETADRKYLKEKYPNIVGFYNTSCKTGFGVEDFKRDLSQNVVKLGTVEEQFPNNWLSIKNEIGQRTSGSQHYLTYETYQEICKQNHTDSKEAQNLLLRYFNVIGAITWFGEDTYLKFLHVLNPAWITQGVYKILTSKKTANLFGQINVSDFKELLQPVNDKDYTYDEKHYGYILSMMRKFDLCYAPDNTHLLIPSAFGKVPRVEYSDFRGKEVRTYILQFKDYMPLALIHRFIAKKLSEAYENNYWYTGIVVKDSKSDSLAMVHADKEAKRIYIRIKGDSKLGMWEHIRREFSTITNSYAKIPYEELVAVDENIENNVNYDDLISHIVAKKSVYFHPRLQKDFNVGYLMGFFETKEETIDKIKNGEIALPERGSREEKIPTFIVNILNNNNPTLKAQVDTRINIDIDIRLVNNISSELRGDASYLVEELGESNQTLSDALQKIIQFADDAKTAQNSGAVKEKSWGRKLKSVLETLAHAGKGIKHIHEGSEALQSIFHKVGELALQFNLTDITNWIAQHHPNI